MGAPWKLRGYAIERLLGSGGSAEVWQARVVASGEPVALKRIVIADPEQRRRAHAEAAMLAALDHPNLVRLHALVPDGDAEVLVLDLAAGGSLADLLAARGRLAPGEVITALAPVGAALAYAHGEGVVHGDVSAANVLFTAGGSPLLADLGVARLTGDDAGAESTPAYFDPAVAAGCVPGPPSDVFMLAAVALHALTGTPVWPGRTGAEALAAARTGRLDDVPQRLADAGVPAAMAAVLGRALHVDPQRRGTAADLALDLRYSGQPVAVELAAGRARRAPVPRGPRHLARPAGSAPPPASAGLDDPDDPARPAFERPSGAPAGEAGEGAPPPTRMLGPRPRPVLPRPDPRRPRRLVLAAGAGSVALLAAVAFAWWPAGRGGSAPAARPVSAAGASPVSTTPAPSSPAPSSPAPSRTSPGPRRSGWAGALAGLDARRARAFATRRPQLLRGVYRSGPLLRADIALLTRMVPAGCGLSGAHTRYRSVHVVPHGSRATVTATATLPPTRVVCGGRVRARARPVPAARLRLELVRTHDGVRIARQRVS